MKRQISPILVIICFVLISLSGCVSQSSPSEKNDTPDPIIGDWHYGSVDKNLTKISPGGYSTVSFGPDGEFYQADFGQVIGPNGQPDAGGPVMGMAPIHRTWLRQPNGTYIIKISEFAGDEQLWEYSPSKDRIYNVNQKEKVYFRPETSAL
jgi:hypothetical protein